MVASPSSELAELADLAAGLSRAVGRFRRSLNRRVRAGAGTAALPEAQLEILRLVDRRPGLRVHDVAAELRLASNTVSTLVRRLADSGLVERIPDPGDGRVAHLRLRPAAERRLRRWRDHRQEILVGRLEVLAPVERLALTQALPLLERIAASLEDVAPASPPTPGQPAAEAHGAG